MYQQLTDFINKSRMAPRPGRNSSLYLNSRLLAAVALFGSLLVTGNAQALLVNIDFQPADSQVYTGQGILGDASDNFWNSIDYTGATDLLLSNGSAGSGVSVSTSMGASYSNLRSDTQYPRTNTLLADRVFGTDNGGLGPETITVSGLAPNSAYSVALYNGFYAQSYSVNGQPAATDPVADSSANTDFPNWTSGVEYDLLSYVLSDNYGRLVIQTTPPNNSPTILKNTAIAGLQVQSASQGLPSDVPVPSALYLFATGILGLAGIARRGKARQTARADGGQSPL